MTSFLNRYNISPLTENGSWGVLFRFFFVFGHPPRRPPLRRVSLHVVLSAHPEFPPESALAIFTTDSVTIETMRWVLRRLPFLNH